MRAKELLYANYRDSEHFDVLLEILDSLLPLREDKAATDDYFERKLSADLHRQEYLYHKELFDNNSVYVDEEPQLIVYEGEVKEEVVRQIRSMLFDIVKDDESFGFLFFHLGTEYNAQHKEAVPLDCYPNISRIRDAIALYRDDYPKASLNAYLDDDLNYHWYKTFEKEFLEEESEGFAFFNSLYRTYDQIRLLKGQTLEVRKYYATDESYEDDIQKYFAYQYVIDSIEKFNNDDHGLTRIADVLKDGQTELAATLGLNAEGEGANHTLRFADGWKEKVCVIMQVMQKLGAFERADGTKATQKQVMEHLSASFGNLGVKDPSPLVANARSNNRYVRHIEELLKAAKEEEKKSYERSR